MRSRHLARLLIVVIAGASAVACQHEGKAVRESMVRLPGGAFTMGCVPRDTQCDDNEKPAHRVTLSAFSLDLHEVTVAEYEQCVDAKACRAPRLADGEFREFSNGLRFARRDHPVNGVDWNDAYAFCRWRRERLPTEAEFEYALRGGAAGQTYPWGDRATPPPGFGDFADNTYSARFPHEQGAFHNFDDGYVGTAPVCAFTKNPFGLCDISGNVREWTADWFGATYYQSSPADNPKGPPSGTARVLRGGSWMNDPWTTRTSYRGAFSPDYQARNIGFRCARD